jgi:Flp pilus assembly protein TadD
MASGSKINRALALKLAASTILVGSVLVSCSAHGGGGRPQSLSSSSQKALAAGKTDKALEKAEAAVALDPRNPELRKTLAQAYLANGRFASARQSLDDALALGDASARTVISLALMHVAEGRTNAAQALLEQHRETIPASDYGLALAVAGDTKTGVEVLAQLIRSGDNAPKVRQNLAFAYALDGRWREAQIMAGQDLDPQVAQERIAEWARIAHPRRLCPARCIGARRHACSHGSGPTGDACAVGHPVDGRGRDANRPAGDGAPLPVRSNCRRSKTSRWNSPGSSRCRFRPPSPRR